jgi:hypothetical protein
MPLQPSRRLRINLRRKQVADLYLQGWTQAAIAAEVGVTQPTISHDLEKIQKAWREDSIRDFDLRREIELQKIDRVEREAWAAWERSQKPDQSAQTYDDTNNRRTRRTVRNRNGDPRYLDIVLKCGVARRELLGLDAPKRMEIETDGPTVSERSARLIAIAVALGQRAGTGAAGAGLVLDQPGELCADRERGALDPGPPPLLPGPGDHRVD